VTPTSQLSKYSRLDVFVTEWPYDVPHRAAVVAAAASPAGGPVQGLPRVHSPETGALRYYDRKDAAIMLRTRL
jgi:hypothetical protein